MDRFIHCVINDVDHRMCAPSTCNDDTVVAYMAQTVSLRSPMFPWCMIVCMNAKQVTCEKVKEKVMMTHFG